MLTLATCALAACALLLALAGPASARALRFDAPHKQATTDEGARSLVSADFDGNGRADLAWAEAIHGEGQLEVLRSSADGWVPETVALPPGAGTPADVVTGNFDGDSAAELAVADPLNDSVYVVDLSSFPMVTTAASGAIGKVVGLVAADLNGDGREDIGTASFLGGAHALLNTTLGWSAQQIGSQPAYSISAEPAPGEYGRVLTSSSSTSIIGYPGGPDGWYGTYGCRVRGESIWRLKRVGSTSVALLSSGDKIGFAAGSVFGCQWVGTTATGAGPVDVTGADFDRDDIADLATANRDDGTVGVLRRTSASSLSFTNVPVPVGGNPTGVAAGDFDADGDADVAVFDATAASVATVMNTTDVVAPVTTDNVPAGFVDDDVAVTLSATDGGRMPSGVAVTR